MKKILKFAVAVSLCELAGVVGAIFTTSSVSTWYATLHKPPFSPPDWLFAPVWTALYFLMGVSLYLVWSEGWRKRGVNTALQLFGGQLALNVFWSYEFFGLRLPADGLFVISALWVAVYFTTARFYAISKRSGLLMLPYLLWVSFAWVLNLAIVLLN